MKKKIVPSQIIWGDSAELPRELVELLVTSNDPKVIALARMTAKILLSADGDSIVWGV